MATSSTLEPRPIAHTDDLPDIRVQLNQLIYADGDSISVTVHFGGGCREPEEDVVPVVLGAPSSRDIEVLALTRAGNGTYVTDKSVTVRRCESTADVDRLNGVLSLQPNEMFFAMYFIDTKRLRTADTTKAEVVVDQAIMEDPSAGQGAPIEVIPELAMTDDERRVPPGGKRIGTVLRPGGLPVQLPVDELVLFPVRPSDLEAFLDESGGVVRRTDKLPYEAAQPGPLAWRAEASLEPDPPMAYLVGVDPDRADLPHLPQLRTWFEEKDTLYGSSEAVLRIYALALHYQMRGFRVGVNPRLQFGAAPRISELAAGTVGTNMLDRPDGFINVQRAQAFMSLWDFDDPSPAGRRINVAFLDMGFAVNPDYRRPPGGIVECDLEGGSVTEGLLSGFRCGPGVAQGPPTVGNSFFGRRSWHGNGVVTTAAGVGNNGFGGVGVGGQVVVPMLYRFGLASYAFEIGLGIRRATLDGASVINLSAGYPCHVIANVGVEFNICSPAGRAALCAAATAALGAAAGLVCAEAAAVGAIPLVGPILAAALTVACAAATTAAAVASASCFAMLAAGDPRGPMRDAISFATSRGVPVVTIAGNRLDPGSLPPVVRDIVDLTEARTDRWQIVPAMIPGTIVVGSVNPDDLTNADFFGSRVDLWAPEGTIFFAPPTVDALAPPSAHVQQPRPFGGTSCAAPYVAGVIALMQAIDTSLDPTTRGLSAAARAAIPGRIRAILTTTAFSNATLSAGGIANPGGERGNLVNPFGAVRAAARSVLPDTDTLGYDRALNFDEVDPTSSADTIHDARTLVPGAEVVGTILTVRGEGSVPTQRDADFFQFAVPTEPPGLYVASLILRTPTMDRFGTLRAVGDAVSMGPPRSVSPVEEERTLRTAEVFDGTQLAFGLEGAGDDDNLYKLELLPPLRVADLPEPDRFDRDDPAVNPPESRPNNDAPGRAVHLGTGEFAWQVTAGGHAGVRYEIDVPDLNFHHPDDNDWFLIVQLPPHDFFEGPGCQPELFIEFGPDARLSAYTEDRSILIMRNRPSPVRLPGDFVLAPLLFGLRPERRGEFVEYDLRLTFRVPSYRLCRLAEMWRSVDELAAGQRELTFPDFLPDWAGPDPAPDPFAPSFRRGWDEAGRIVDPDNYIVDWAATGDFRLAAEVEAGSPMQVRLLAGDGEVLAETASTAFCSDGPVAVTESRGGALEVLTLEVPRLPRGDYVLALSHGLPGSRLVLDVPAGVTREKWARTGATHQERPLRARRMG
jgi:hypothetical protein